MSEQRKSASGVTRGAAFTDVRPPQGKDLVWARVGDVWYPARVEDVKDGTCTVRFFQRIGDLKKAVLNWLAPSADSLLFAATRIDVLAFDVHDSVKGSHPAIQDSMVKLRDHFGIATAAPPPPPPLVVKTEPTDDGYNVVVAAPAVPAPSSPRDRSAAFRRNSMGDAAVAEEAVEIFDALELELEAQPLRPQPRPADQGGAPADAGALDSDDDTPYAMLAPPATRPAAVRAEGVEAAYLANAPFASATSTMRKELAALPPPLRVSRFIFERVFQAPTDASVIAAALAIDVATADDGRTLLAKAMARAVLQHTTLELCALPLQASAVAALSRITDAHADAVAADEFGLFCSIFRVADDDAASPCDPTARATRWSTALPALMLHSRRGVRQWARRTLEGLDATQLAAAQRADACIALLFVCFHMTAALSPAPTAAWCSEPLRSPVDRSPVLSESVSSASGVISGFVDLNVPIGEVEDALRVCLTLAANLAQHLASVPAEEGPLLALTLAAAAAAFANCGPDAELLTRAGEAIRHAMRRIGTSCPAPIGRHDTAMDTLGTAFALQCCSALRSAAALTTAANEPSNRSLQALCNAQALWYLVAQDLSRGGALHSERSAAISGMDGLADCPSLAFPATKDRERPIFIAAERLQKRAFDASVADTSTRQRGAIAAYLHVHFRMVWGSLGMRSFALCSGLGSAALLDPRMPRAAAATLSRFVSLSTLHLWLQNCKAFRQSYTKVTRIEEPVRSSAAAEALPSQRAVAPMLRALSNAVVIGCVLADAVMHAGASVPLDPAYTPPPSSVEPPVPPTAPLQQIWPLLSGAWDRVPPILVRALFLDVAATMRVVLEGDVGKALDMCASRLFRPRTGASLERETPEEEAASGADVIAEVRRMVASEAPTREAVELEAAIVGHAVEKSVAAAPPELVPPQPPAGVSSRDLDVRSAVWAACRDGLHILQTCTSDRRRETVLRSALPVRWAQLVRALTPRVDDSDDTKLLLADREAGALSPADLAWRLGRAVLEWSTAALSRDTMLHALAGLPRPPPDMLALVLRRQQTIAPTCFGPLLVRVATAVPEPTDGVLSDALNALRGCDRDGLTALRAAAMSEKVTWLAELAANKGVIEARQAATRQADLERRYAQFELVNQAEIRMAAQAEAERAAASGAASKTYTLPHVKAPPALSAAEVARQRADRERRAAETAAARQQASAAVAPDDTKTAVPPVVAAALPLAPLPRPTAPSAANYRVVAAPPVALRTALSAEDKAFERGKREHEIARDVQAAKDAIVRIIIATNIVTPTDAESGALVHHGADGRLESGIVGPGTATMAREWPPLRGPDFDASPKASCGALVSVFAPYIAVEMRHDIESNFTELKRSERPRGGSGSALNIAADGDCLGQAVKIGAGRDDRRGVIVQLRLRHDFDGMANRASATRNWEGEIFVIEVSRTTGTTYSQAAFSTVGVGVKPAEGAAGARLITVLLSRELDLVARWARYQPVDVADPAAQLTLYRVGSFSPVATMVEACGAVGLLSPMWSVLIAPETHCKKSDVVDAIAQLNEVTRPKPDRPATSRYNDSQIRAISSAVVPMIEKRLSHIASSLPFCLVQGPPGTGKTHTIVGLIIRWLSANAGWVDPTQPQKGRRSLKRVLVCTPSNIAVDEIGLRLQRHAVRLENGERWNPVLVRLGVRDSVDPKLLESGIFVDDCIKRYVDAGGAGKGGATDPREAVLEAADVVLTTFGSLRNAPKMFPLVVADEAAMTTEPMLYTSLLYGCERAVLVGDPEQLQATLRSRVATQRGYSTSLMQRLVSAGYPCTMLNIQYRMHPRISEFPSAQFYHGQLLNADDVGVHVSSPSQSAVVPRGLPMPPYAKRLAFFDVGGSEKQAGGGASLCNEREAAVVVALVAGMAQEMGQQSLANIGVISFYQGQVRLIRDRLRASGLLGGLIAPESFANTVDGFQGREKGGIILSCVRAQSRASNGASIGFVADSHRMNVALTRAQSFCYIVGDAALLEQQGGLWRDLIRHAIDAKAFLTRDAIDSTLREAQRTAAPGQMPCLPIPLDAVQS